MAGQTISWILVAIAFAFVIQIATCRPVQEGTDNASTSTLKSPVSKTTTQEDKAKTTEVPTTTAPTSTTSSATEKLEKDNSTPKPHPEVDGHRQGRQCFGYKGMC